MGDKGLDFKHKEVINISFIGLQAQYHNWKKQ